MRVLVCGGRDYHGKWIGGELAGLLFVQRDLNPKLLTIITGGARGVDTWAERWALHHNCGSEVYPANWNRDGRAAGSIRNQQMLDTGIDLVIAFAGGRGTADMVRRAKKAGVEVVEVIP